MRNILLIILLFASSSIFGQTESKKENYKPVNFEEAVEQLKKRGFSHNLSINENGQLIEAGKEKFPPSEVKLVEFHRFEGTSDPADMSIVYALETRSGLKGTVVDTYGAEGSETVSEFMNNVEQGQYEL